MYFVTEISGGKVLPLGAVNTTQWYAPTRHTESREVWIPKYIWT